LNVQMNLLRVTIVSFIMEHFCIIWGTKEDRNKNKTKERKKDSTKWVLKRVDRRGHESAWEQKKRKKTLKKISPFCHFKHADFMMMQAKTVHVRTCDMASWKVMTNYRQRKSLKSIEGKVLTSIIIKKSLV
jgi:hypothetical protein